MEWEIHFHIHGKNQKLSRNHTSTFQECKASYSTTFLHISDEIWFIQEQKVSYWKYTNVDFWMFIWYIYIPPVHEEEFLMNQLEHRPFEQKSKDPWEKIVQHTQLTSTQLTLILPRRKNKKTNNKSKQGPFCMRWTTLEFKQGQRREISHPELYLLIWADLLQIALNLRQHIWIDPGHQAP